MDKNKTTDQIREKAAKMKGPMVAFLKQHLGNFGDLIDQLRVMGWLGQGMVDMANQELAALKMQEEAEKPPQIKVYQ